MFWQYQSVYVVRRKVQKAFDQSIVINLPPQVQLLLLCLFLYVLNVDLHAPTETLSFLERSYYHKVHYFEMKILLSNVKLVNLLQGYLSKNALKPQLLNYQIGRASCRERVCQ